MTDDDALPKPILTPGDELALQQLLTLDWLARRTPAVPPVEPEAETASRVPTSARTEWTLTGGTALYPWQEDCLQRWFDAGGKGTAKVVTGAGKTLLALALMERLQRQHEPDLRVAIVVPTVVLMNQWFDELRQRSNLPASWIARLGGGYSAPLGDDARVVVAVLKTAHKELPSTAARLGWTRRLLLVVDECHRAGAPLMKQVFQTQRRWSLGLSATPEREGDEDEPEARSGTVLDQALGGVVYELSLAEAVRMGIVPSFTIRHYGLPLTPDERATYEKLSRSISDTQADLRRLAPHAKASGPALFAWARAQEKKASGPAAPLARKLAAETSQRKRLLYGMAARASAVEELLRAELAANPDARAILFHETISEVMALFVRLRAAGLPVVAEHSGLPDELLKQPHIREAYLGV